MMAIDLLSMILAINLLVMTGLQWSTIGNDTREWSSRTPVYDSRLWLVSMRTGYEWQWSAMIVYCYDCLLLLWLTGYDWQVLLARTTVYHWLLQVATTGYNLMALAIGYDQLAMMGTMTRGLWLGDHDYRQSAMRKDNDSWVGAM